MKKKTILINPISPVHARNVEIFKKYLPEFHVRSICNPRFSWYKDNRKHNDSEMIYFPNKFFQRTPPGAFEDAEALILFTAQSRVPACSLVEEASRRSIPVIAVEEVHTMMLEQGYVNNYVLPVDHLFVMSGYERDAFIKAGVPEEVINITGNMFRGIGRAPLNALEKDKLKKELGLASHKPVATLGLAFLSPHNETIQVRKKLIEYVSRGLPDAYSLLIKPHPSEQEKDLDRFVHAIAPEARIAPAGCPIDSILDITDIFFNRGNSQTVIDALEKKVPVIPVPVGRTTLFKGLLDKIIVSGEGDVKTAIDVIKKGGMPIYDELFSRYLTIGPEKSLENIISGIRVITEAKQLYKPQERLLDISLFWAWMGFTRQALKTLSRTRSAGFDAGISEKIARLVSKKADRDDLSFLRKWCGTGYKERIIQSLWISILHARNAKLDSNDREWFKGFPPEMNRLHFLPYAELLYWKYIESDMASDADAMVRVLPLLSHLSFRGMACFNIGYWKTRFNYSLRSFLKDYIWTIR